MKTLSIITQKLTFLDSIVNPTNNVKIELWYLTNPSSGNPKSLVSYWNGTLECSMGIASFTNIDVDQPIRSIKKQNTRRQTVHCSMQP